MTCLSTSKGATRLKCLWTGTSAREKFVALDLGSYLFCCSAVCVFHVASMSAFFLPCVFASFICAVSQRLAEVELITGENR